MEHAMAEDSDVGPPEEYREALGKRGFTLQDEIGGGAFGVVYKAEQRTLARPVAVKFFRGRLNRSKTHRERFEREGKLLARVQHPAIPYVITTGEVLAEDGRRSVPYIVMQFIEGNTVHKMLKARLPRIDIVYRVMRDVLSALQCAHEENVVHRDVKPDNIVVGPNGTYLLDFSLGMVMNPEPSFMRATRTGAAVGTERYAAPEQLEDATTVDRRTDIYSAGVVFAEMLGAKARLNLGTLDAEIPEVRMELRDIIRKAAAENPVDRYATATEFQSALDVLLDRPQTETLEPTVVLCPGHRCRGAIWSPNGYLIGARVSTDVVDRNCDRCGTVYLRGCPKCRRSLPENIDQLVIRGSKRESSRVPPAAYCSACGALILEIPTCRQCHSFLRWEDIGTDTNANGCKRCRERAQKEMWVEALRASSKGDDIPF